MKDNILIKYQKSKSKNQNYIKKLKTQMSSLKTII